MSTSEKGSRLPVNPGLISNNREIRVRCCVRHTAEKKKKTLKN